MMTDLDVMYGAATLLGEAEGEGDLGMELVAWVIRNRVGRPRWPENVVGVVLDDFDFSFWNSDSRRRSGRLTERTPAYWNAVRIFTRVWDADREDDPTDGADHYFNPDAADPSWQHKMFKTLEYKRHAFYDASRNAQGGSR